MRHGTKIGIGLVVALGIVCGVIAMGGKKEKTELAGAGSAESSAQAPAPAAPENTGAAASPQPMNVALEPDRSLRPRVETPAPETPKDLAPAVTATPAPLPTVTPTPAPAPVTEVVPMPALTPEPAKESSEITELPPIETAAKPEAPKPAPVMEKPRLSTPKVHVVQAGESYSSIAAKYFGSAKYASLIAKANPGKDPRKLYVGAKVNLPPAPAGAVTTQPAVATVAKPATEPKPSKTVKPVPAAEPLAPIAPDRAYQVKAGEHWTDLAQRFLGNSNRWPELYELNKERVSHDPHALKSGTTIELPPGAKVSTRPS